MKNIYFIILCLILPRLAIAQSPGGVSGASLWYKADAGVTQSGTAVSQWNNQASASYNLIQGTAANRPAYNTSMINFNPSIRFDGSNDAMSAAGVPQSVTITGTNPYAMSQYIVYRHLSSTNPLYSHSDGGGGIWNIGAVSSGNIVVTNRNVSTSAPTSNEVRLQELDGNSNAASSYLNGSLRSSTFSGATQVPSGAQPFWVGAQGTNNFTNADISEIVIYNTAQASRPRIESYLSLKYGISKSGDYIASNGTTTYWSATTNSGYTNNVAGIGRDDNSGLHQKQSRSESFGNQVLISTTGVANTNQANTVGLNDGQFLVWGDNNLSKTLSTALALSLPAGNITHRFAAIWRVQNTGTVGTVRVMWPAGITNLHLVQSIDANFDALDTYTSMSATQTINGVTYAYADVSLGDGKFFTFAGFQTSPGGVTAGLKAWYKADTYVAQPSNWEDVSGNGKDLVSGSSLPTWNSGSTLYNFNPNFTFTGVNNSYFYTNSAIMGASPNANLSTPGSIFSVSRFASGVSVGGSNAYTAVAFGDDDPNLVSDGNIWAQVRDNDITTNNLAFIGTNVASLPTLIPNSFWNTSGGSRVQLNGTYASATNTAWGGAIADNLFVIGSQGWPSPFPSTGSEFFNGGIPEVIIYNQNVSLNATDAQRINTYLAIKYGVTLSHNYLSSSSSTMYNISTYSNNIAGIARDDLSGLNQKQSMSVNSGNQVILGLGTVANTNAANAGTFAADKQALVWGDNALTGFTSFTAGGTTYNNRLSRIWKVQNTTNLNQNVQVLVPVSLVSSAVSSSVALLFNASDATFASGNTLITNSGTTTINSVSYYQFTLPAAQVNNATSYFTVAVYLTAPGGVVSDLQLWLKADVGLSGTTWNDQSSNARQAIATTGTPTVSSAYINFNPSANVDGNNYYEVANDTGLNQDASNRMTLSVVAIAPTGSYGVLVNKFTNGNWDDGWGMAQQGNTNNNMGFWTGRWDGGAPTNAAYTIFTPNTASLFFGYSTAATGNSNFLAYNGGSAVASTSAVSTATNIATVKIGNQVGGTVGYNPQIAEVIMYNANQSGSKNKIESYLALKYGITLNGGLSNYVNSSGGTVWTTDATYKNNIAGIARDDASGLHQKQSMSINSGKQLLISTTGAANTNQANTVGLNNGQFLVWGDNNLSKTLSTALALSLPAGNITHRFDAIWKVANTGTVGTVRVMWPAGITNLHLVQSTDATFDASDTYTSMSATQTINGVTYAYADVSLGDGRFFTLAGYVTAPGGVLQPDVWLRADVATSTTINNANVAEWENYGASGGKAGQLGTSALPTFTSIKHNFNPAITDNTTTNTNTDGSLRLLNVYPSLANRALESYILMSQSSPGNTNSTAITYTANTLTTGGDAEQPRFGFNSATDFYFWWSGPYAAAIPMGITRTAGTPYISGYSLTLPSGGSNTKTFLLNGKTTSNSTGATNVGQNLFIFADSNGNDNSGGDMSEIITYSRVLTTAEKAQLNSYLAIKYGITYLNAAGTGVQDYFSSNSTSKIWNASANTSYNNNIAGIARDDASGLSQKVSTTSNTVSNGRLKASTINNFTLINQDTSRTNFASDMQYEVFGDNNNTSTAISAVTVSCPALSSGQKQIAKKWRVQETGTIGPVYLEIDLTGYSLVNTIQLLIADNDTFTTNAGVINALSFSGGKAIFYVDFKGNSSQYFTVVGSDAAGTCTSCIAGKQVLENGEAMYNQGSTAFNTVINRTLAGTAPSSGALNADITFNYSGGATEYAASGNPRKYGKWAQLRRYDDSSTGLVTYTVNLKDASASSISAIPSFQIAGINKQSETADVVKVRGYCGTTEVLPKLLYAYNSTASNNTANRRFTINSGTATATGVKSNYELNDYATMNVEFASKVDKIVIEWTTSKDRTVKRYQDLFIGNMTFVCDNPIKPNSDMISINASYQEDQLPTCEEATIKIKVNNQNCSDKVININNTLPLPTDLQYVANSYVGLGSEAPTYSNQSFSLTGLTVPSGISYLYIRVKPTNAATSGTYATQYSYTVTGGANSPNPYLSDDESGQSGFQPTSIAYTATTPTAKPEVTVAVDKCYSITASTELTYTITVKNTTSSAMAVGELLQDLAVNQTYVAGSFVATGFSANGTFTQDQGYVSFDGYQLAANSTGTLVYKVNTNDSYNYDETDTSVSANGDFMRTFVKGSMDPSSSCAGTASIQSNELIVYACTFCTKDPNTLPSTTVTKIGITLQSKQNGWPESLPNGAVVLESKTKGLVITRTTSSAIANPVEGMLIYDTVDNCIKLYNGTSWNCVARSCNQ